jgi:hypothetical protein
MTLTSWLCKMTMKFKKMIIYVNVMLILCLFMSILQTDRQTDKHIKSIARNLTNCEVEQSCFV